MIDVIVNPIAGNGHALKTAEQVTLYLDGKGIEHRATRTADVGHATQLARRAVSEKSERVFCVGGDGTVLEVLKGLAGSDVPLGVIPGGTGNDFAITLGLPKNTETLVAMLLDTEPTQIDMGLFNDKPYLNIVGVGFDVEVLQWSLRFKHLSRGMLPYLLGVFMTIFTHKDINVDIRIGDNVERKRCLLVAVANGKSYGGGMKVARDADISDGKLNLITISHVPKLYIPFLLPRFLNGSFITMPIASHQLVEEVSLEGNELLFNIDGEIFPANRASLSIANEKLWIIK